MKRKAVLVCVLSAFLMPSTGCEKEASFPGSSMAVEKLDPGSLAAVLNEVAAGNSDAAMAQFLVTDSKNWIESSGLRELQFSESEFLALGKSDRSWLQEASIQRCQDIKTLAMLVLDAALEEKANGNAELSQKYTEAVNQLGEQLQEADVTLVFQQLGEFLANAKPGE